MSFMHPDGAPIAKGEPGNDFYAFWSEHFQIVA